MTKGLLLICSDERLTLHLFWRKAYSSFVLAKGLLLICSDEGLTLKTSALHLGVYDEKIYIFLKSLFIKLQIYLMRLRK